ncbi:hypothetical protein Hanom_Chr12g01173491 [Helianthus anomalus]
MARETGLDLFKTSLNPNRDSKKQSKLLRTNHNWSASRHNPNQFVPETSFDFFIDQPKPV